MFKLLAITLCLAGLGHSIKVIRHEADTLVVGRNGAGTNPNAEVESPD